jgi:hypothetical protein
MMRRTRTLLLEGGLVMAAIVLGAILNNPVGYGVAAILAVIFLVAWGLGKEDGEEEFEGYSLFNGAIPAIAIEPTAEKLKISQNDPLVYLKVADDDRGGVRATPFVLENLGGGVARKVQIPDVAGAKFDEVDMIPVQRTREVLPKTDRPQIFGANNILPLLDGLWDQGKSNSNEEIAVRFTISYQDEEKHDFEIDVDLTYLSMKDKIRQSSLQRRGSSFLDEEIVKIRHLERRRLS